MNRQASQWRVQRMTAAFDQAAMTQQFGPVLSGRCPACHVGIPEGAGIKDVNSSWPRTFCSEGCCAKRESIRV